MVTTYLFERNKLLREGLKSFLDGSDFVIASEYERMDAFSGVNTGQAQSPDLIITGVDRQFDTAVNGQLSNDFINQATLIKEYFPDARLVVLVSAEEICHMPNILQCNADGYLLQESSRDAILGYLKLVMIGEKVLPQPLATLCATNHGAEAHSHTDSTSDEVRSLSKREHDIVQRLALGESNKLIARHLDITESTVKVHLKTILRKLGAKNRTQAALLAVHHGIDSVTAEKLEV